MKKVNFEIYSTDSEILVSKECELSELVYTFKKLIPHFEGWKYCISTSEKEIIISGVMDPGDVDVLYDYFHNLDYAEIIKDEVKKLDKEDIIHVVVHDAFSSDAIFLDAKEDGIKIQLIGDTETTCYQNQSIMTENGCVFVKYENIYSIEIKHKNKILFYDFISKSLSNDLLGIVDNITRGKPFIIKPAWRFVKEHANLYDKYIKRFTFGTHNGNDIIFVELES